MTDPMDLVNAMNLADFREKLMPPSDSWSTWEHPKANAQYTIELQTASDLSTEEFDACFNLIQETSAADYKKSKDGWKPRSKRKEMKLLDLKYLLVKNSEKHVDGFVSFMPTYEDDYAVVYTYEIHLSPSLQATGLGSFLMKQLELVALNIPSTEKIMLTCFLRNKRAVSFYEKMGYVKDEFSPPPKMLRNGALVEADYVILSKPVVRDETKS